MNIEERNVILDQIINTKQKEIYRLNSDIQRLAGFKKLSMDKCKIIEDSVALKIDVNGSILYNIGKK